MSTDTYFSRPPSPSLPSENSLIRRPFVIRYLPLWTIAHALTVISDPKLIFFFVYLLFNKYYLGKLIGGVHFFHRTTIFLVHQALVARLDMPTKDVKSAMDLLLVSYRRLGYNCMIPEYKD